MRQKQFDCSVLSAASQHRVLDYKLATMKRLKRRRPSWMSIIFGFALVASTAFLTINWWKQSDESPVRGDDNQWRQVTEQEKTAKKMLGLVFGISCVAIAIVSLRREFNGARTMEVVGENFEVAYELSDDQIVEIGPLRGLNGHALAVAFCYECDWEPRLKSFKLYRFAPPVTCVSYHVQLLNDKAQIICNKIFAHEAKNDDGEKMKPFWKEELLPLLHSDDSCFLRVHPIFDRKSLAQFDPVGADKRLTIRLQIKVAACVSPQRQTSEVPQVSQARAIVHRVLDSQIRS